MIRMVTMATPTQSQGTAKQVKWQQNRLSVFADDPLVTQRQQDFNHPSFSFFFSDLVSFLFWSETFNILQVGPVGSERPWSFSVSGSDPDSRAQEVSGL